MGMRTFLHRFFPSRKPFRQAPPSARGARLSLEMLERRDLMSAGSFDPTFGDGRAAANFRDLLGGYATASAVAVQADGKVVIAGTVTPTAGNSYFGVVRLKADGTPDQTFGYDGRADFGFSDLLGGTFADANAVAIDAQGRIVVAGIAGRDAAHGGGADFAVGRLTANGYYDESFGSFGGRTYFGFRDILGDTVDEAYAVAIDAQGRIVVAGLAGRDAAHGGGEDFAVGRLTDNGYFDTSFGFFGGRTYFGFSDLLGGINSYASAVAIDAQGRIVLAGTATRDDAHGGGNDFAVGRLTDNGYFDASFGFYGGRTFFNFRDLLGGTSAAAYAVAIDAQGRIVLAGSATRDAAHGSGRDFAVGRLSDNGYFDESFGAFGRQYFGFRDITGGYIYASAKAVAIDAQGRIVLAGGAGSSRHGGGDVFAVGRLSDNGFFDESFGSFAGRAYVRFSDLDGGISDSASGMAIDAQGRIVLAGASDFNFLVTRLYGDTQNQLGSVPDLTGVSCSLTSLDNGTTHAVVIQSQADNGDGTATITGIWDGGAMMTGTVQYDADGNIHILFYWTSHTFYGTLSGDAGAYQLDGMVIVLGGGGPGHCVGSQV
jgi:uncharacterized delta-60 repeat protein